MGIGKKPEYVVVTAVSTFRQRYVVPMSELQKLNPDNPVDPAWAMDEVTCQGVKEFSQRWLGEQILDCQVVKEDEILQFFDADNDYLAAWPKDYKLAWINHWKENPTQEEEDAFEEKRQQLKVGV